MEPHRGHESPEAVLRDARLTDEQKIEILRRWEYDERGMSVALDEGMAGPEPRLLGRVLAALGELGVESDPDHGAAHKQGGASPEE